MSTSKFTTAYDSVYIDRVSQGFDMDTGRNMGCYKNGAPNILKYLKPRGKGYFGQLYAHNSKLIGTQKSQTEDPDNYLSMD